MGKEFAAPVSTHGGERERAGQGGFLPQTSERAIYEQAVLPQHALRLAIGSIAFAQFAPALLQLFAQAGRRTPRGSRQLRVGHQGWSAFGPGCGGAPADKVNTSCPVSVTSTVCSHCADKLWSLVTMVQPSDSSRIAGLPAFIIGSMVKIMPGRSG